MWAALGWGLFAGSSLILGGVIALVLPIRERWLGLVMAFGAGVLISAVAFELVEEAFEPRRGGGSRSDSRPARSRSSSATRSSTGWAARAASDRARPQGGSALAIVLGIVLDGIPESAVIGLTLLEGTGERRGRRRGLPLEPPGGDRGRRAGADGWARRGILGLWVVVALVRGLASLLGYAA